MEAAAFRESGARRLFEGVCRACDRLTRQPVLAVFAFLSFSLVAFVGIQYQRALTGPLSADGDRVVIGDFLAFYTGARILAEGRGAELYDLRFQREVQDRLAGRSFVEWQPYVNPPLLAVAVWPLTGIGILSAFRLYSTAMVVSGLFGAAALVGIVPALAGTRLAAATVGLLALGFHPIARTMFGGQNAVLTWALLTGGAWAVQRRRHSLAGVLLGLLSYKPQYVPFLALLLLWARAWRALGVALAVVTLHYLLGAWLVGSDWPLRLLAALERYRPMEWAGSLGTHFSLLPFFDHSVGGMGGRALAAGAMAGVLVALWRFAPRARPGSETFPLLWSLVIVAEMLTSPHLQYYDFAILVSPVAIGFDRTIATGRGPALPSRVLAAIVYVAYPWFSNVEDDLSFQPLTIWMLGIYAWLCWVADKP